MSDSQEADLHTVTDKEWLRAHARLGQQLLDEGWPHEELEFVFDPSLNPTSLIDEDEVEEAPRG